MFKKLFFLPLLLSFSALLSAQAISFYDDIGRETVFNQKPQRIVSLIPEYTDMILALGMKDDLVGVTYQDTELKNIDKQKVVGSYQAPQKEIILTLKPDLVMLTPEQNNKLQLSGSLNTLVLKPEDRLEITLEKQKKLGRIFGKEREMALLHAQNQKVFDLVKNKIARISQEQRKRVIRIMGVSKQGELIVPGDDALENEMIQLSGGITPQFDQKGSLVTISVDQWNRFNPEVIYSCSGNKAINNMFIQGAIHSEVAAVKNRQIRYLSCHITAPNGQQMAEHLLSLSALIYPDELSEKKNMIQSDAIIGKKMIDLDLPYIQEARVAESRIDDYINRTLLVSFKRPQNILSTADGFIENSITVGNHYNPMPLLIINHKLGFDDLRNRLYQLHHLKDKQDSLVFTGADMNNLIVSEKKLGSLKVVALVTAGVEVNALRMSKDTGTFEETGTINIILLTNRQLSEGAMARAIVTITEAKTAALWDMDIRSVQTPLANPATGTGTDSVIVAGGEGSAVTYTGGHARIGQLIAESVYEGVQKAILKQNGWQVKRNILSRLQERKINISSLLDQSSKTNAALLQKVELAILKDPAFMEMSLSLNDAYLMGQLSDLSAFEQIALQKAQNLSGKKLTKIDSVISDEHMPIILKTALNAIITGIKHQTNPL